VGHNSLDPVDNWAHGLASKAGKSLGGGGGGSSEPTLQQKQLETQQALETARLNIEENSQRKSILNGMNGMRVFRGSALSRAVAGNTAGQNTPGGAPSGAQRRASGGTPFGVFNSLLDPATAAATGGTGATSAGGAGASGASGGAGSYRGGGGQASGKVGGRLL